MWRTVWLGAALALATTATAEAADAQSRFQAYGLGRLSCKRFVEMCEGKKEECKLTGTWLQGYLTGFNALNQDTFDLLPWQPSELVAEFSFNVCKQNPDAAFLQVVNEVVREVLYPQRITSASERTKIGEGENATYLYRDTVRRLQQRLVETGHLTGGVDGSFGPGTQGAVEAFQRSAGLPPTGIPDQRTLIALFYGAPAPPGQAAPRRSQRTEPPPAAPAPSQGAAQPVGPKLDLNLVPAAPQ
jgi:peptidoglycan hydrolase-like protein with peptidoglycan-binding domain